MPNLEERASQRDSPLFCYIELVTCNLSRVKFFHYLCVYENSDKYNIDRINLISFIHCCYLFNRGKD